MGKLIKWSLIALVVALIVSNISIKTSLYKAKDNSVEISFPNGRPRLPGSMSTGPQASGAGSSTRVNVISTQNGCRQTTRHNVAKANTLPPAHQADT